MRILFTAVLMFSLPSLVSATQTVTDYRLPVLFEPNHGQFEHSAKYQARSSQYTMLLTDTGAKLQFPNSSSEVFIRLDRMELTVPKGVSASNARSNYFTSNQSITDVPAFSSALQNNGSRPNPVGGLIKGEHRGDLVPEGAVDNPSFVKPSV